MMIRNIRTNIYKILTGYGFYICIIFTAVLCFSAYIYEDSMNGDKYSVFMAYKTFDKDFMLSDTRFCSFEVMLKGAGSWLSLLFRLYLRLRLFLLCVTNMRQSRCALKSSEVQSYVIICLNS